MLCVLPFIRRLTASMSVKYDNIKLLQKPVKQVLAERPTVMHRSLLVILGATAGALFMSTLLIVSGEVSNSYRKACMPKYLELPFLPFPVEQKGN